MTTTWVWPEGALSLPLSEKRQAGLAELDRALTDRLLSLYRAAMPEAEHTQSTG